MEKTTEMGMNRTGVQMSPIESRKMQSGNKMVASQPMNQNWTPQEIRSQYIESADPVGSVPLPGTMKGALSASISALIGNSPSLLLDKLGERLAFERTGTRLYDAVITKVLGVNDPTIGISIPELQQIRDQEAQHFALVAEAITSLGGDPTCQTPCADVTGVESQGLMQVVTDPRTNIAQSLHALLVAELADNNGWELLIALAEENGQSKLIPAFTAALNEERVHLRKIQSWMEEALLGKTISALPGNTTQVSSSSGLH